MKNGRAEEVVLDREQERRILRELGEMALRLVVELLVVRDLVDEPRQTPLLRHCRHAQENAPGIVVLGDSLERLEVAQPQTVHVALTSYPGRGIRAAPAPFDISWTAAMNIGDVLIHRGRAVVLLSLEPMSVPDRLATLQDAETGEVLRVPVLELEEGQGLRPTA